MKYVLCTILVMSMAVMANQRTLTSKIVVADTVTISKRDTIRTIKCDTIFNIKDINVKIVKYDTLKITKVIKDTNMVIILKQDTVKISAKK